MADESKELLAVLLSDRATGLLMIGACKAAADNCQEALAFVSDYLAALQPTEGGAVLGPKLYNRKVRALLRLGEVTSAEQAFHMAIEHSRSIMNQASSGFRLESEVTMEGLEQVIPEATLGRNDAASLRDSIVSLYACTNAVNRSAYLAMAHLEALGNMNTALTTVAVVRAVFACPRYSKPAVDRLVERFTAVILGNTH